MLPPSTFVRLIDQLRGSCPVVQADGWWCTSFPVVEHIAQGDEIGRRYVGAREHLVPFGRGELHRPILHCEDGVAARDLPLAVSAVTGEQIPDLDSAENAARRTQQYRSVVFDRTFMGPPAQLRTSHLRRLSGQVEKHVQPVRAQVPEAAAAGLCGIEHPAAIPSFVACRPWPVDPNVDVRQGAETLLGDELASARGKGSVTLGQRDSNERI